MNPHLLFTVEVYGNSYNSCLNKLELLTNTRSSTVAERLRDALCH